MTSYALFLGCTIPARQPNYELSARKALAKLGIELVDLANMTCCCPPPIQSIDLETSLAVAAYNICLAEEADLNIVTLCSGCFESLAMTNAMLKNDEQLKAKINRILSQVGKEFLGSKEVKHFLQVLMDDVGLKRLKQSVSKPLSNLKVAPFYGCHALRPSELLKLDDPERPSLLENLIETLGAEIVEYRNKLKCCGGLLRGISDDLTLNLAREKLANTTKAGADCIVTLCPFCFVALDIGQMQIKAKLQETYDMPVLHYSELLALALGIDPKELALQTHKIKTDKILNKIS
ncbi:CoB--CoM heterodisulfide reductase subunit B [Candidatus Bathyarchaeota archaeon]|nr:CoB--CoM heterodisulfide reductase subunit B [Candidatus Korarchaeota archaeon]NIU39238.1 CoB--CoM heterodisulfide reductase subunit B [Candidatus Bathyarchaeota archaeon]